MKSEIVHVNQTGMGMEEALQATTKLVSSNLSDTKTANQICHLAEEILETLRHMAENFEADYSVDLNDDLCEIRIKVEATINPRRRSEIKSAIERYKSRKTITDQIRGILESGYEEVGEAEASPESTGLIKAGSKDLSKEGEADSKDLYVWSMQSHAMSALMSDETSINEDTVTQISSSILANLADDIRVYVFKDSAEIIVEKKLSGEGSVSTKGYAISPEFDLLKKIPVPTSLFQVRMTQALYYGEMRKQRSTDTLTCQRMKLPVSAAPSGELECLLYSPNDLREGEAAPFLFLAHGGAFVLPALPYHFNIARTMADATHCRVIMPDYDLAPIPDPPVQQEECYSLYEYLINNADSFGIDTDRIALMGDSAGGTICAAMTLMIKDRGIKMPKAQLLLYPSLDTRLESESMKKYTDVPVVNAVAVDAYYKMCHFDDYKGNLAYASPVQAPSHEGLPDAYIETAEFDCLHDDGILYANLLGAAGCNVVLNETKGTVHAFDIAKNSSILKEAMAKRADFLRAAFN